MKLLIITQKVDLNDDNLGFFHYWLEKFAGKLEKVYVIGLAVGRHNLPENVMVYSLGKEKGYSKLKQFFLLQKILFKHLKEVDGVFAHMCSTYGILCFPLSKIFKKRLIQWHAHGVVTFRLKLINIFADGLVTSSLAGCRINSKKVKVIGQGIDTNEFKPDFLLNKESKLKILSVGRISQIKDQITLVKALDILINQKNIKNIEVNVIGSPIDINEKKYFQELKSFITEKKMNEYINFLGGLPYKELPKHYQNSNLVVNTSSTGSMDKVVLESMASGCLVLTCNEAYSEMLENKYRFQKGNAKELADKIFNLKHALRDDNLREIVVKNHSLDSLVGKIIQEFHV